RIGGADRYETAAMVSSTNFQQADTVVLATGSGFADALSASGLAGCVKGPVLLTKQNVLPAQTLAEIKRLGAKRVIIVGGEAAVASAVAARVAQLGVAVERIGGRDRYATAAMISSRVVGFGQSGGRVFIARGDAFADALSLGPLAYAGKAPLILVQPTAVPPATRSFLSAHSFSSGCLAGGTAAVSNRVRNELALHVPGITRLAGDSRYDTAVAVAAWGVSNGLVSYNTVGIATGVNFADALCGGIAAGSAGGVILLTTPDNLHQATSTAIAGIIRDTRDMQIYGGEAAVSAKVMSSISAMSR
ncbi:MAG: cell wall-binding repeat-containing protein, partial [Coriobacteriia bacterium]|nr:cell wall-binding repeat-containing protein [Coriobacteriia bacterium]